MTPSGNQIWLRIGSSKELQYLEIKTKTATTAKESAQSNYWILFNKIYSMTNKTEYTLEKIINKVRDHCMGIVKR